MFKFNRPLELPPQLQWEFAHEPELLGWTIRARNYNTFVADIMFWTCFIAIIVSSILIYLSMNDDPIFSSVLTAIYFVVVSIALTSITHQRMNFAYRFSQSGAEYCNWQDFPEWALKFLKWLAGVTAIIFIFMATIDPYFLLGALVGPGGVGLTYLSMAYSKSYRELHIQYHYYAFNWEEFTQLAIATNREIVDLKYRITMEGDDFETKWNLNIYCQRKQKEKVAEFIKPYLSPGVPCIRAKVNVPLSTD